MTQNVYIYIFIMAAVTYAIRVLPLTLIRKPIENQLEQAVVYIHGSEDGNEQTGHNVHAIR